MTVTITYSWDVDDLDALKRKWLECPDRSRFEDDETPSPELMVDEILENILPDYSAWGLDDWTTVARESDAEPCARCGGDGYVETERDDPESIHGVSLTRTTCPDCAGVAAP